MSHRYDPDTDPHISFDPATVAPYTLPSLMRCDAGTAVTDARMWWTRRREEIVDAFATHIYGRTPARQPSARFEVRSRDPRALDGAATRTEVDCVYGSGDGTGATVTMLLYVPNGAAGPVPAFVGLNFWGNHTIDADPGITLPGSWMPEQADKGVVGHRATDAGRGCMARRWPLPMILCRGYAVATAHYGEIDPDRADGFDAGIHPVLGTTGPRRRGDQWGKIGAWAWGLSRMLDYLVVDPAVDHRRVAVVGHSRLGKTALWAAAQDPRFAMVISNNSGCAGASLFRHTLGERLHVLSRLRPHWFAPNFARCQLAEHRLPVDQHMLLALAAPRPVYVASATEDRWADPTGEYLSLLHAAPAWRLHGIEVELPQKQPAPDRPLPGPLSYHLRTGAHDILAQDWGHFLHAADDHL